LFAQEIVLEIKSAITGIIGKVMIFYRQHPEPEKIKIMIP
jgi:RNA-binding protein YhbY